ncbi:MAG: hypothetical protein HYR55_13225 [Acidobacteria bacterium]|nr:hypothetical protein [Acidobacteriota bacterium]
MNSETNRRHFLGTGLSAVLALLAARGFNVTQIKAQKGPSITITGLTSAGSDSFFAAHVHGFQATLNLETGEFSGTMTATIATGEEAVTAHPHTITASVVPFDFDAVAETTPTPVHTHQVRPN